MENPLLDTVDIPFRGGSIRCRLDLAALLAAETETNIPIISPSAISFAERPVMVQLSCYLYALIASGGMKTTMDEVRAMLTGPKAEYITNAIAGVLPSLEAHLEAYYKQFGKGGADPLADGHGGPGSGPMPSSVSESVPINFGRSRRAK